jgi:hypothetical protein
MVKRLGGRWLPVGGLLVLLGAGLGPVDGLRGRWGGTEALAATTDEEPRPIPEAKPEQQDAPSLLDQQRKQPRSLADDEEKPFYKSTVFWVVTGVLVVGAVGLGVYAANHGSPSNLGSCPASANLGCYGAGR